MKRESNAQLEALEKQLKEEKKKSKQTLLQLLDAEGRLGEIFSRSECIVARDVVSKYYKKKEKKEKED